nr:immunoglobulin heavy chain junction region [Mus musculus]
CTVLANWDDYW